MTRFDRIARRTKLFWLYVPDKGRDRWRFPKFIEGRWRGDCEDYCFRVIWKMEGSKAKAVKAIEEGKYVIWWARTHGPGTPINHAVVEYRGQFAEVIYGKASRKPNDGDFGPMVLHKPYPGRLVLQRLGYASDVTADR